MARVTGRRRNAERKTPYTDAWIAQIAPAFAPVGSRSDFARFVVGLDATHGQIVRWTNNIARWLKRQTFPTLEQYFLVMAWLASRRKKQGRKAAQKARTETKDGRAKLSV
jgi:hypothetical protein